MATLKCKYVAEGFLEDAGRLLNEFVETNSVDFPVFASIWKKRNFSLVFMGRADKVELSEFTNEAYRIATQFLSGSYLQRVGAIFLLYGLFRNQVANPPIRIRIELSQLKVIDKIWKEAAAKNYLTLNYVIDYLINNAFAYVANQTLKGPMIGTVQTLTKNAKLVSNLKVTYKDDLCEFKEKNKLSTIQELQRKYLETKKELEGHVNLNLNMDTELYSKYIQDIDSILHQGKRKHMEGTESIGLRRAKIKAAAFINKSSDFRGRRDDSDDSSGPDDIPVVKKKSTRPKRVPKYLRRVGRPKKNPTVKQPSESEASDIDLTDLLSQQRDFYLPPEEENPGPRKRRAKAIRQLYYKPSPKHDDDDDADSEQ